MGRPSALAGPKCRCGIRNAATHVASCRCQVGRGIAQNCVQRYASTRDVLNRCLVLVTDSPTMLIDTRTGARGCFIGCNSEWASSGCGRILGLCADHAENSVTSMP